MAVDEAFERQLANMVELDRRTPTIEGRYHAAQAEYARNPTPQTGAALDTAEAALIAHRTRFLQKFAEVEAANQKYSEVFVFPEEVT